MGGLHFQHGGKSDVVLVPQPSSSPYDPLNWTFTWKMIAIYNQACERDSMFGDFKADTALRSVFCLVSVMAALSLSPMTPYLIQAFAVDINRVTLYVGQLPHSLVRRSLTASTVQTGVCVIALYVEFLVLASGAATDDSMFPAATPTSGSSR